MRKLSNLWWLALVVIGLGLPMLMTNPSDRQIAVYTLIFTACATSWNMFSGYSGYVNLGAGVFYGTGAYSMGLLAQHLNMSGGAALFWLVPLSGVIAMVIALPVGMIALRVRRHTFVVITIAIFFVFQLTAINAGWTGGSAGLPLPFINWGASYYQVPFYYVALGIVIFAVILSALVRRSRFGLQLLAIRDDEDRALGLGVQVAAVKLTGYVMSAFVIGMSGAVYAMFQGQIYPQFAFDPLFDITVALMCFFGGFGTLVGPVIGGLVLESAQQYLTVTYSNGSLYLIIFGVLFLVVILFMPRGIAVYVREYWNKREVRAQNVQAAVSVGGQS